MRVPILVIVLLVGGIGYSFIDASVVVRSFSFSPSISIAQHPVSHHAISAQEVIPKSVRLGVLGGSQQLTLSEIDPFAGVDPALIGKPLVYPNPFRKDEGAEIGYQLSKPLSLEIYIYNMLGHLVSKKHLIAGENGGLGGADTYNRVSFRRSDVMNGTLSASGYFFVIVHDGEILGRGKMAVIP